LPKELHPIVDIAYVQPLSRWPKIIIEYLPKAQFTTSIWNIPSITKPLYCFVLQGRKEGRKEWKIDHNAICQSFPLGSPLSRVNSRYPTNALKKHPKETSLHNWHNFPKK
jgi:hypothetical protein